MKHEIKGQNLINGNWIKSQSGEIYNATNPATGESLQPVFSKAGKAEVDAALELASETFKQSLDLPPRWQATLLDSIAEFIMGLGDELIDRGEAETGLPKARLIGERARTTSQLKMFAEIVREGSWVDATIDTADPKRTPQPKPDLRRMVIPRGPAVVFGASNFPFAFGVCGGDTASALAAGCPVVVKGHPSHPGVNELFASAVLAALKAEHLPLGLFAVLQGKSHELSAMLVKHPATEAVGFTGSRTGGRALFDMAAARPKPIPVFAEMGSLNPLVILPGALSERGDKLAEGLANSVLLGAGQFCTKPGLIFLIDSANESASPAPVRAAPKTSSADDGSPVVRSFIAALIQKISASASFTMLNKTLRDAFADRAASWTTIPGVKTLVGGDRKSHASMAPVLFETTPDAFLREPQLHEEIFGPGTLLIPCKSIDESLNCIEKVGGSLTGTLHMSERDDKKLVQRALRGLESLSGRIIINGFPTGVEVCHAIVHGGPYPATTDPGTTSVGAAALRRFTRMIAFQDTPQNLLPPELRDENPLKISRLVNGYRTDRPL